jgi:hypothetical protein
MAKLKYIISFTHQPRKPHTTQWDNGSITEPKSACTKLDQWIVNNDTNRTTIYYTNQQNYIGHYPHGLMRPKLISIIKRTSDRNMSTKHGQYDNNNGAYLVVRARRHWNSCESSIIKSCLAMCDQQRWVALCICAWYSICSISLYIGVYLWRIRYVMCVGVTVFWVSLLFNQQ